MTWGVVSPGSGVFVGDADQRSGHRPVRRNAGRFRGRQVCITWMREHDTRAKADTVNTLERERCSRSKTWACSSAWPWCPPGVETCWRDPKYLFLNPAAQVSGRKHDDRTQQQSTATCHWPVSATSGKHREARPRRTLLLAAVPVLSHLVPSPRLNVGACVLPEWRRRKASPPARHTFWRHEGRASSSSPPQSRPPMRQG
jgi:hypothetical protein